MSGADHIRFVYMGWLSNLLFVLLAVGSVLTVAAAIVLEPVAGQVVGTLTVCVICFTILVGDILIKLVTPDPFNRGGADE